MSLMVADIHETAAVLINEVKMQLCVGFCLIFWLISSHKLFIQTEYLVQANTSIQGYTIHSVEISVFFLNIGKSYIYIY